MEAAPFAGLGLPIVKQEQRRWLPELLVKSVSYKEPELAPPEAGPNVLKMLRSR